MTSSGKLHQFKRNKPIYKSRFFWISIAVLIVIGALFYLTIFASFFEVERVKVSGSEKSKEDKIRKIARKNFSRNLYFVTSHSLFLAKTKKIETEVNKEFPVIHEVNVKRVLPDELKVVVKERKPVGIFVGKNNFLIDKRGVAFEASTSSESFLISYQNKEAELGKVVVERKVMDKILTIKERLEEITLKKVVIKSENRLDVITQAGWEAYFDLSKDWEWQISKLKIALEREISETEWKDLNYIDLRFDKTYYK